MNISIPSVFRKCLACTPVALLLFFSVAQAEWQGQWIGTEQAAENSSSTIAVQKAVYGVAGDPARQVDLTKKLQQAVAGGVLVVSADNATAGRDPAHGTVKTLELEYTVDGKPEKRSLAEDSAYDLVTGRTVTSQAKPAPNMVNQWSCFRKVLHLEKAPKRAVARIAADSKYWLWINGELVVFEGQLKRGPTPDDTYFDRVNLAPYLRQGDNTIAVLLWYFGKHGFSHKSSGKAGLVFDAELNGARVLSDGRWKSMRHPAYGTTGEPRPNFRLPESNIHFDARKDIAGWEQPGFDDSSWPAAAAFGQPPCAPWNRLVERPIPLWKDFGLKDYVNAAELPKVSNGQVIKAKLPYNAQVTPYLEVEGSAGKPFSTRNVCAFR